MTIHADFTHLPEPEEPPGLTAAITARIAQLDEERARGTIETPRASLASRLDQWSWVAAIAGVVIATGAETYRLIADEAALDLASIRLGTSMGGVTDLLAAEPTLAILTVGLLLYLAGMFAPVRGAN